MSVDLAGCVLPVPRFRSAVLRFLPGLVRAWVTVSVGCCAVPRWPGVLPVPRFRWLVCGSSLAGRLPVPQEGFDFDFDLDLDLDFDFGFDLPSAPFLISPSGCGGEIRNGADGSARRADAGRGGADRMVRAHSGRTACHGGMRLLCGCCVGGVPATALPTGPTGSASRAQSADTRRSRAPGRLWPGRTGHLGSRGGPLPSQQLNLAGIEVPHSCRMTPQL